MTSRPSTPAANAVSHGLTAKKYLPAELSSAVAEYRGALFDELVPQGPLAEILVAELARHGAAMQLAQSAEAAALQVAAQNATALGTLGAVHDDDNRPYVAAMASDIVERTARYRRQHERSFFAALAHLHELHRAPPPHLEPSMLFASEDDCAAYLQHWQRKQKFQCPHCQHQKRITLRSRQAFECENCHHQFSDRCGTLYANSHLPLMVWFAVVQRAVVNPNVTSDELLTATRVARRATIATVRRKVLAALASPDADRLLAGVNRLALASHATWVKRSVGRLADKTNNSQTGGSIRHQPVT